jgi:signal transduction histidine kinase/CheY-like chemotaxis protein
MSDESPESLPAVPAAPQGPLGAAARNDRRIVESLNEGVWERNLITGEAWYSKRYKALLGFADHELPNVAEVARERVHLDDRPAVERVFADIFKTGGAAEVQARMRMKDGTWRWFRARTTIWPDPEGRPALLVGALYDVHDVVLAADTLRAQHTILEDRVRERTQSLEAALAQAESQRLAAERANQTKAAFLAHMSHELRTPLNGVLGMTQLAQALARGPEQRRYLELAQQSGNTLLRILDDVLDFARAEAGTLHLRDESFDLAALAAETLRSFMPEVRRKGLQVGFDYVGSITQVRADSGRIRQIIHNLVGNAIKFTDRGRVLLVVSVEGAAGEVCRVRLRVRDTGIGMDDATASRVFEPFEQGDARIDRRHGGTGLGLSIVRLLAQRMGGDVSVRSRPGEGSGFNVDIQLLAEDLQPLDELAGEEGAREATGHAWVLTHDANQAQGIVKRLERIGCTCASFGSVVEALERLRVHASAQAPEMVLIAEDALAPDTDFAALRKALPAGVPLTLLLRPDFDLGTVNAATDQWALKICIAPLTPADLYGLKRPVATGASARMSSPAPLLSTLGTTPSVLVVEDNVLNQIIAREMVAALGLHPAVVGSGEEAVVSCQSTPPDLVLMDIQMPGMDGLETTRRLRALQQSGRLRRFPIIALTAHAMASDRQASLAAGMDEHLTKPVQMEQLRTVLRYWLAVDRG